MAAAISSEEYALRMMKSSRSPMLSTGAVKSTSAIRERPIDFGKKLILSFSRGWFFWRKILINIVTEKPNHRYVG